MPVLMSTPSPTRVMSSSMCSPAERLRLRPWLEKMIEEQRIPGLEWLDEQSRIVKIPWKHAARHGWTRDKDASLFKEWAIHTKKYDPVTDEPKANPKIWKANFRCAINSLPDIEELKDQGKTKGNDAFKVYRLNPKKPKKSKTVTDTTVVRRPKCHRNSKPRTKVQNRQIPPETSSRLSITCDGVNPNVIGTACSQPPPPPYDTVIRERTEHRFPLSCRPRPSETIVQPHSTHSLPNHSLPNHTECCPLPPASFDLPPYPVGLHHVTSRISPVPTPSTPCSTVSSPMSTPSQVSSPVFTYPTAPFSMHGRIPAPLNIKQEPNSPYNDDVTSESSGSMTDEEIVDMVDQMREESPLNSPSATSPAPTFENSFNMVSSSNEWMTSTLDNKQFLSNVVTSKVENVTTSSFQSSMNYTPTSVSASYCAFPVPATSIKDEPKPDCAPCLGGESQNRFDGNMNSFAM